MEKLTNWNQLTPAGLATLEAIANGEYHWQEARTRLEEIGIDFTGRMRVPFHYLDMMYNVSANTYNPADYGKNGKLGEVSTRVERAREVKRSMMICDFKAHSQKKADYKPIIDKQGRPYERKTAKGDWYTVEAKDRFEALDLYRRYKSKSLIAWTTVDFTIIAPVSWLLDELEKYPKGAASFFGYQNGKLTVQPWRTSRKKWDFLEEIGKKSEELPEFEYFGNSIGWRF